ncbi:hypothetical protein HAX54_003192 [Datura stramonium]|uniref:Uncharacterized protein n=1 Tax=Datura stramonium TaxID=4076 RepID=A0ABS8WRZ4_DATST|nr:hypothetical protein [Datura stramonium]
MQSFGYYNRASSHSVHVDECCAWHSPRQDKLECWQGGLDRKKGDRQRMAPIGRACKLCGMTPARRWHEQEIDGGCKLQAKCHGMGKARKAEKYSMGRALGAVIYAWRLLDLVLFRPRKLAMDMPPP